MDTTEPIPASVRWARSTWLVCEAIGLVSGVGAGLYLAGTFGWLLLASTVVHAAIAIPAALKLTNRSRWARRVLVILAALSLTSIHTALEYDAWPTLLLNLAVGSTIVLLNTAEARTYFRLPNRRQPGRYRI